jgi:hypothetical protein
LSRRRAQLRLASGELLEAALEDLLDLLATVLAGLPRPPTCSNTSGVEGPTGISPVEAARIDGDFHPFRVR